MSRIVKPLCLLIVLWQGLRFVASAKKDKTLNVIIKIPLYGGDLSMKGTKRIRENSKSRYMLPKTQSTTKTIRKMHCKKKSMRRALMKSRNAVLPFSETPTNFLMEVLENNQIICMGSLISTKLVLSSTKCFPKSPLSSQYQLQDHNNQLYPVDQLLMGTSSGIELAGILLALDINDVSMQPVSLCNRQLIYKDNVNMYMTRIRLNFLHTQVIENAVCKQSYMQNELAYITENMICAQNSNIKKDCELTTKGDPLLHKGYLCGINVYGPNCIEDAVNGDLYVDIFKALDFIEGIIKSKGEI